MKRLPIFLLSCFSLSITAQNWAPFPLDATSEWRVNYAFGDAGTCYQFNQYDYLISGDTVIGNFNYKVVSYTGIRITTCPQNSYNLSGVKGFLRFDDGLYHFWDGITEEVLFDFSVSIGDTIYNHGSEFVVDSVSHLIISDDTCKQIWVRDEFYEPYWIVEGVGHQYGLFEPLSQSFSSGSICYKENDVVLLYTDEFPGSCDILNSVDDHRYIEVGISPNPSTGIFRIETPQKSTYRIYDLFGRIVKKGQLDGVSEIDLSSEPDGIYLLLSGNEKGVSATKLVKQ